MTVTWGRHANSLRLSHIHARLLSATWSLIVSLQQICHLSSRKAMQTSPIRWHMQLRTPYRLRRALFLWSSLEKSDFRDWQWIRVNVWDKKPCRTPDSCCKIYYHLIFMWVGVPGLGLQKLRHLVFHSSLNLEPVWCPHVTVLLCVPIEILYTFAIDAIFK